MCHCEASSTVRMMLWGRGTFALSEHETCWLPWIACSESWFIWIQINCAIRNLVISWMNLPHSHFFSSKYLPPSSFNKICAIWNTTGAPWCLLRKGGVGWVNQWFSGQGQIIYVGVGRWVASNPALEMLKLFLFIPQSLTFKGKCDYLSYPIEPFKQILNEQGSDP